MKLDFITFRIRDLDKSIAFYEQMAGLKQVRRFKAGPGEIAFMGNTEGETAIELINFPNETKFTPTAMVMSFDAPGDLKALRQKALTLGLAPTEIITGGPEPVNFKVADPDGIMVEFCQR